MPLIPRSIATARAASPCQISAILLALCIALVRASNAQSAAAATGADSAYASQQWVRAEQLYQDRVITDTTLTGAWYRLALVAQQNGHLELARKAMTHAIAQHVGDPMAHYRLARLEAATGHRDSALALIRAAVPQRRTPAGSAMLRVPELAWLAAPAYRTLVAQADSLAHPCESSPEAHQFDFWIGDWDVTPWSSAPTPASAGHGYNDVHPILAHCMISENWTSAIGVEGKSTNWYDSNLHKWRQAWMAEGGGPLDYVGEYRDGAMRFEGWTLNPDGTHMLQKLTFFNVAPDTVRQLFEQSADSGKTWQPTFDGRYVRTKHKQ
ncbi:MAG TPA: tetratricopeptide repeat protein [Gemmatimonadales bacterium]|jgi:tetratricopeptide (TPR) repeat protein